MAEAKSRSSGVAWETVFEDVPVVKHSGCLLEVSRQKKGFVPFCSGLILYHFGDGAFGVYCKRVSGEDQ